MARRRASITRRFRSGAPRPRWLDHFATEGGGPILTYLQLRDATKAQYLAHHESIWERLGFVSPWGALRDEATFNRVHAAIVQGVAKHGPFDTSIDFARYAWTGEFHVVRDPACEHGFRVVCADEFHIDKAALIEEILGAAIAIAITLAFPPLAMIAGFIGTILVAIALLALANMAADFVTSNCGVSPAEFQGRLDQLAGEARAA